MVGFLTRIAVFFALLAASALALGEAINGGFEKPEYAPNSWHPNPANVPGWTFFGNSGQARGSTPWSSSSHSGSQYAYLQTNGAFSGRISQTMSGFVPGNQYRIRFWMHRRPGFQPVTLGIRMNGVDIMRPCHSVGVWIEYASDWFIATFASATFDFYAVQEPSDKGSVIDDVVVEAGPPPALERPANPSFELPAFPQGTWQQPPAGVDLAWEFYGHGGIEHGPSSWGSGAQDGNQYAFLQQQATFFQRIGYFEPGRTYHAEWYMMRRNGNVGGNDGNAIRVLLDELEVFPFTLHDSPIWKNFASRSFSPAGPTATIRFEGAPTSQDKTELFDNVRIFENTDLVPVSFSVVRGRWIAGTLDSLAASDDQTLQFAPRVTRSGVSPPVQVVFEAVAPFPSLGYLALSLESSASVPGLIQTTELWDFEHQQWEGVDQRPLSTVDGTMQIVRSEDAGLFIDPLTSRIRSRVSIETGGGLGARTWLYRVDLVRFSVTRP